MRAYYNEIEKFPCQVIEANIARGRLPAGRVHCADICHVFPDELRGYGQLHLFAGIGASAFACVLAGMPASFSICTFGFPCQDISSAGKGKGITGARSGLFFEAIRIIRVVRPTWLLVENVPALRTRGIEIVIAELEAAGYCVLPPIVVGADDVEAPHKRKRVWIVARLADESLFQLANADSDGQRRFSGETGQRKDGPQLRQNPDGQGDGLADANCGMFDGGGQSGSPGWTKSANSDSGLADAAQLTGLDVCGKPRDFREPTDRAQGSSGFVGESGADVADANSLRQQQSCGHLGESGRWLSDGGEELAHAAGGRLGISGGASRSAGYIDECGQELADSHSARQSEQCSTLAVPAELTTAECCGSEFRWNWPARPGESQHDWEEPRTIESPVGLPTDGPSKRLVRLYTSWRRNALKGLGNAWVPQTAVPILKWIYQTEMDL
ncbi:MAG TPA: DNA cytosine methyltransferase [Abditibacterium sp.]